MVRRITAVLIGICFLGAPLAAQKVEGSFNYGYTLSEGVSTDDRAVVGIIYNKAEVNSGAAFNFTFGAYVNEKVLIEFLYGRQSSKFTAEGPSGGNKLDISDLSVDNYHVTFVYHWGEHDAKVRPFAFGGAGASYYSFGNLLLTPAAGQKIAGNTQFSTTWGGGVKYYASPNIGVKAQFRYTPTYIKSTQAGYWCDPFYGCWVLGNPDYANSLEMTGGVTFRF